MLYTGNENHGITLSEASQLTANFRDTHPNEVKGFYFGKQAIIGILTQDECVGIRLYNAQDAAGKPTLVVTGVDCNGDDLYQGQLAEFALPCPTHCSSPNPLNS